MVASYRVLAGTHYDVNPDWEAPQGADPSHAHADPNRLKKFVKGEFVQSDRELDKIFEGKFEKVIPGVNGPMVVTPERVLAVNQLIQGGRWIEEDRTFLQELTEGNFQRVVRRDQGDVGNATEGRSKLHNPLGEEVTHSFQRAYDEGFKVFKTAKGFNVTRGPSVEALNKKPLTAEQVDKFCAEILKG
jgi:hypothetical protein